MNYNPQQSKILKYCLSIFAIFAVMAGGAYAQNANAAPEFIKVDDFKFIINTMLFLFTGFLVMWMAAGFAMLEAGLVRTKNVGMQCTKNIALYAFACIMFYLMGYNLMYPGDTWTIQGILGNFAIKDMPNPADENSGSYASASDFYFQLMFCATTASIVSGTVAERVKIWSFMIFIIFLTGVLYPIAGSWDWGGGWLESDYGFKDFAGSSLVHSVGGWAALAGALVIGARNGKYHDGKIRVFPGSSLPLATLGTFILWLGWFGFNGGSQLAMGTLADASSVARIFVNTNMAACAGAVVAMLLTQFMYGKVDLTMICNGALAGLVSITAEPLTPTIEMALLIGAIGGVIVIFAVPMLDKLKIDDVVGAIPVHLCCGIWGTIAVVLTNPDATLIGQLVGIIAIAIFIFSFSLLFWAILKATIGVRPTQEEEYIGLDKAELGMEAYPEFGSKTTS